MAQWTKFKGMAPGYSPAHLPRNFAQEAVDCFIGKGDALYPERKPLTLPDRLVSVSGDSFTGTAVRIWQSGDVWFAWDHWVDVIEDPRAWGSPNAFLYVDQGKIWRHSDAWHKASLPPRVIGIGRVDDAPTATVMDTGTADWSVTPEKLQTNSTNTPPSCPGGAQAGEARSYVVCFVNDMQEESAPSFPSEIVRVLPQQAVNVQYAGTPPAGTVAYRWYRTLPGEHLPDYRFVSETTLPVLVDAKDALQLQDMLETRTHWPAMDGVQGIARLGVSDVVIWSGTVVWNSAPRLPHAFPPSNRHDLPYPVVGGRDVLPVAARGNDSSPTSSYSVFLGTTRRPYFVVGEQAKSAEEPVETGTIFSINVDEPCVGPHAMTAGEGAVFYSSTRGIVRLDPGRVSAVTDDLFMLDSWKDWDAGRYQLGYQQGRIFGVSADQTFVMPASLVDKDRLMSLSYSTTHATACHTRHDNRFVVCTPDNKLLAWGEGVGRMRAKWTSRLVTNNEYYNPGAIKVDMDLPLVASSLAAEALLHAKGWKVAWPELSLDLFFEENPQYEPVREYVMYCLDPATVEVYREKRPWSTKTITSRQPHRLPRQGKGIYWHFTIHTDRIVYRVMLTKAIKDMADIINPLEEG